MCVDVHAKACAFRNDSECVGVCVCAAAAQFCRLQGVLGVVFVRACVLHRDSTPSILSAHCIIGSKLCTFHVLIKTRLGVIPTTTTRGANVQKINRVFTKFWCKVGFNTCAMYNRTRSVKVS